MIFCFLVIVGVLSKRRARALRTPTTPRPASASASAMTPTVRLSLNYCTSSRCWKPNGKDRQKGLPDAGRRRADVFDYIERFYNTIRRHSTNGYLSPVEFERKVGLA